MFSNPFGYSSGIIEKCKDIGLGKKFAESVQYLLATAVVEKPIVNKRNSSSNKRGDG